MNRCKLCVMPDTRPDTPFVDGVCAACLNYANRPTIDWDARKRELIALLDRHDGLIGFERDTDAIGGAGGVDDFVEAARDVAGGGEGAHFLCLSRINDVVEAHRIPLDLHCSCADHVLHVVRVHGGTGVEGSTTVMVWLQACVEHVADERSVARLCGVELRCDGAALIFGCLFHTLILCDFNATSQRAATERIAISMPSEQKRIHYEFQIAPTSTPRPIVVLKLRQCMRQTPPTSMRNPSAFSSYGEIYTDRDGKASGV